VASQPSLSSVVGAIHICGLTVDGPSARAACGSHSTQAGLISRIAQRLLALAAGLWHNSNIGDPGRHLTAYDH
jgi:hypothetical protein